MELYARVRREVVVDKMSEREAAKQFGLARETVRKTSHRRTTPTPGREGYLQSHDVANLIGEQRVFGKLERLGAMGLQRKRSPDAADRTAA